MDTRLAVLLEAVRRVHTEWVRERMLCHGCGNRLLAPMPRAGHASDCELWLALRDEPAAAKGKVARSRHKTARAAASVSTSEKAPT